MRNFATLFGSLLLLTCSTNPAGGNRSPAAVRDRGHLSVRQEAPIDPPVQLLLAAAAADFHEHPPPHLAGFRDVRIGHVMTAEGEPQYLLCGYFLVTGKQDQPEWTAFATIKTSGYEQWLGNQAASLCRRPSISWDEGGDLSSSLQRQLESLK